MLKSYLKAAWRNILKKKLISLISITGLAIALAVCILVAKFVYDELRYDRFYPHAGELYRIALEGELSGIPFATATSGGPAGLALKNDFPEVINACRLRMVSQPPLLAAGIRKFYEEQVFFADSSFFAMFGGQFLAGDPRSALAAPHSMVLTESIARKYFGDADPLGKTLTWNEDELYTISAVVADPPQHTHLKYHALASFSSLAQRPEFQRMYNSWFAFTIHNYVQVSPTADINQLQSKLPVFLDTYMGEGIAQFGGQFAFFFQPVTDIHLRSDLKHEFEPGGDINKVYIFASIAILMLLIAGFNYINLQNAASLKRFHEVGMRKILGASRRTLFGQFLLESVLITLFAILLALLLVQLSLPTFNDIAGTQLDFSDFPLHYLVLFLAGLFVVAGLLTSIYPAIFLSAFRPLQALKGERGSLTDRKMLKHFLVGFQFTVSIALISTSLLVVKQLDYIRQVDTGIAADHVLVLPLSNQDLRSNYPFLKDEFSRLPGVVDVSAASNYPGKFTRRSGFLPEGFSDKESMLINNVLVDPNFTKMMGLRVVAGRDFFEQSTEGSGDVLINRTLQLKLGWQDPIGKTFDGFGERKLTTIGVVEDFHFASFHKTIEPLIISASPAQVNFMLIRISPEQPAATLGALQSSWERLAEGFPFEYFYLDESIDHLYHADWQASRMVIYFTALAILIACLGLFALAQFNLERRTKEIGIRKVLGASVSQVVMVLSGEFLWRILAANLVAWPLAYWVIDKWLENFAYQIDIGVGSFMIAGFAALLIALLTIGFQSLRAARANPVEALKYE